MPSATTDKSMEMLLNTLEAVVSRLKGRPFTVDRRIPASVVLGTLIRRSIWLLRGLVKTTFLQGRPSFVFMGPSVRLRNARLCTFGKGTTLETGVLIDGLSTDGVHLGENVTIGAYSQIRASMLSNLGKGLRLNNNSSCEAYSFIGAAGWIEVGENVIMGQHVSFHAENHVFTNTDIPIRMQGVTRLGITIEDDCWVGANVVFLDGCHIGRGCVIAAGAVVRGDILPYSVIGGVPAKLIRQRLQPVHSEEV
jgi:acetyltransferase-like isoleucine patch superfamily enzyme